MGHHQWTKTQKKEIYRLAKKGVKYDEIAEKYGVSMGAIAGQVHWYRKDLEKEKKSRLRKKLYQKKKLLKQQGIDNPVEKLISSELTQQTLFKRGRPKNSKSKLRTASTKLFPGRPKKYPKTPKVFPAIEGESNMEDLITKMYVEGSRFIKLMEQKGLLYEDLKKQVQLDARKYREIIEEIVKRNNEKDFGEETVALVRECAYLDEKIFRYILKFDPEKYKQMVERATKARELRQEKKKDESSLKRVGRGNKVYYKWKPEAKGKVPKDSLERKATRYFWKKYPNLVETSNNPFDDISIETSKKPKKRLEIQAIIPMNGEIGELVNTIDKYEKSLKKALNLLNHLSEMSWVQRANSKPIIDAAIEELE